MRQPLEVEEYFRRKVGNSKSRSCSVDLRSELRLHSHLGNHVKYSNSLVSSGFTRSHDLVLRSLRRCSILRISMDRWLLYALV